MFVPTRQELIEKIKKLPYEVLPELATFIAYLQYRADLPVPSPQASEQPKSGSAFLLSIAGLGQSDEDDLSERDEEILVKEIDPIRGWSLKRDS
jgi:hypothetical protein